MRTVTLAGRTRRLAVAQAGLEELRSSSATLGLVAALRQTRFEHATRRLRAAIVASVVDLAAGGTTLPQLRIGARLTGAFALARGHAFLEEAASLRRALLFAGGGCLAGLGARGAGTQQNPSEHEESAVPEKAPSSHHAPSNLW
jgi:hypothetical protein